MTNATDALRDALYNLRELTQCRCHPAFTDRGRVDPDCNHEYRDDVEALDAALAEARRGAERLDFVLEEMGVDEAAALFADPSASPEAVRAAIDAALHQRKENGHAG